jgi:hypothetical protein
MFVKPHLLFINILLIGGFSLSLLTPEQVTGVTLPAWRGQETLTDQGLVLVYLNLDPLVS